MPRILDIVLIDDSTSLRMVIKKILTGLPDYITNIKEAEDGKQALKVLNGHNPDIIFTDINMPEMDGLEFITRYRQQGNTTPIIIISTDCTRDTVTRALKIGANGYIKKPFTAEKITEIINRSFNSRQL